MSRLMAQNAKTTSASPAKTGAALEPLGFKTPDPDLVSRSMSDIAERSQRIVADWLKRQPEQEHSADPLNIGRAFMEMTTRLMANPSRIMQAQLGFWQDYMTLWQNTAK